MRLARGLFLLALAAAPLAAQENTPAQRVRAALDAGDFEGALALAGAALDADPGDGTLRYLQAQARCGRAREIQRADGHVAALDALEPHVGTHALVAEAYARVALWAGAEERALGVLEARIPEPRERAALELELLAHLRRYREAAERARDADWEDGVIWAEKRAAQQERLEGRARRAWRVTAVAAVVLLVLAAVLFRIAPGARSATS